MFVVVTKPFAVRLSGRVYTYTPSTFPIDLPEHIATEYIGRCLEVYPVKESVVKNVRVAKSADTTKSEPKPTAKFSDNNE